MHITDPQRHVCQVAFSTLSGPALRNWYAQVFGFVMSSKMVFFPPSTSRVQGIPGAWEKCSWLIDQQDYFQLEFFQFWRPQSRPKPLAWRPCDIGYNMMGVAVRDLDQVLRNVAAFSGEHCISLAGEKGERRAYVRDPESNWVEIYERDPVDDLDGGKHSSRRPEIPAVVRSMRASVPDLQQARRTYVDALGFEVVDGYSLHTDEDEAHWGLAGAKAERLLVRASNFLLELVKYEQPAASYWPEGYSLSDQGIMNIALGYRDRSRYDRDFSQAVRHGMEPNGEVLDAGVFRVMYLNDKQGFSTEMLYARKALWSVSGFSPSVPYVEIEADINAPASRVWECLTDHAGLGRWSIFTGLVLRPGVENDNGTGCIRELSAPGMRILEEVTSWVEGAECSHYTYKLLSGAPFKQHQGDVFVWSEQGTTRVRWVIRFESWIPFTGRIIAFVLGRVFRQALHKLKVQLES